MFGYWHSTRTLLIKTTLSIILEAFQGCQNSVAFTLQGCQNEHMARHPKEIAQARGWLLSFLRYRRRPASLVNKHGRRLGLSWRTLARAKALINAKSYRIEGRWFWYLSE
jgi:hypothetical protein